MQTVISLAPLVICIITAVMTRKEAEPLTETTEKYLRIANLVGLCLLAISVIWTIIGGIFSMAIISSYSRLAVADGFPEAGGFVGASFGAALFAIIFSLAVDLAIAYWHYYLLEKKLGGFKNSLNFKKTSTANPPQPPVIEINADETSNAEPEKENITE